MVLIITSCVYTLTSIEIQFRHLQCVGLTISPTETENYDRLKLSLHDHLDHQETAGALLTSLTTTPTPTSPAPLQLSHSLLEVVFTKVALRKSEQQHTQIIH